MNTGQIISGAAHAGLITWALVGGLFEAEPLPFEVTEVTAISSEEYAALIAQQQSPEAVANVDTPEPPQEGEAPAVSSEADTAPSTEQPKVADTPPPDEVPDIPDPQPAPEAEVGDEPPVLQPPQEDVAVLLPDTSARPQVRPAPRVAPEPVAQPDPDVQIDEIERQETAPSDEADEAQPEEEATAPEEATTEIVTEAEEAEAAAPTASLRPKTRPARTQPAETDSAEDAPATDGSAVDDALAEALGQSDGPADTVAQGPPLTAGEKEAFRVAVGNCWSVDPGSPAAKIVVTVGFRLTQEGRVDGQKVQLLSSSDGDATAVEKAFASARRAILRCDIEKGGYNLPIEKYDRWRDIEMTFNPERMRIK
ncbi:MAG: energy transducer TonB [Rhodobacteraceae bacterium]|nr:energy transducer TonB [Paracoccaceae bacterium]